jgi:CDGSH iron-sulfur domain-containing protein 3
MTTPTVAGTAPLPIEVEAGKTYYWCSCGLSKAQPFCDGSHKGTGMAPLKHDVDKDGKLWFCTCKQTKGAPLCDGSHKALA